MSDGQPADPSAVPPEPLAQPQPSGPEVIHTQNEDLSDGVNRCPRCGATDISARASTGTLICLFCRHEWSESLLEEAASAEDLTQLRGTIVGSGASDIDDAVDAVLTMKCAGCGAEVVINTNQEMAARCHWCRHVLTVNEQIPNGAVPDAVLPFRVSHEDAVAKVREFAGKRRLFAHRGFVREYSPENLVPVYLPYMVVDGNVSASVWGVGEIETRRYTRGSGNDKKTYYDADVYNVHRHVDFTVDDLTLESSGQRAQMDTAVNTNNVINAILPFDTENAVRWNASYLNGVTSEKRDQDVDELRPALEDQLLSIGRSEVAASVRPYDRGVRWEKEQVDVHGTKWVAMYLPVWLYSYYHEVRGKGMVHYIAVNGRTGETMGSIPVSHGRLLTAALTVGTVIEALAVAFLVVSA